MTWIRWTLGVLVLAVILPATPGLAEEKKELKSVDDPTPSQYMERAGCPDTVRPRAIPSNTYEYAGYYVGGGVASCRHGGPPDSTQGVYGWDYFGRKFKRTIALGWSYNHRYQGGQGQYETDGPEVRNIFGFHAPEREGYKRPVREENWERIQRAEEHWAKKAEIKPNPKPQ